MNAFPLPLLPSQTACALIAARDSCEERFPDWGSGTTDAAPSTSALDLNQSATEDRFSWMETQGYALLSLLGALGASAVPAARVALPAGAAVAPAGPHKDLPAEALRAELERWWHSPLPRLLAAAGEEPPPAPEADEAWFAAEQGALKESVAAALASGAPGGAPLRAALLCFARTLAAAARAAVNGESLREPVCRAIRGEVSSAAGRLLQLKIGKGEQGARDLADACVRLRGLAAILDPSAARGGYAAAAAASGDAEQPEAAAAVADAARLLSAHFSPKELLSALGGADAKRREGVAAAAGALGILTECLQSVDRPSVAALLAGLVSVDAKAVLEGAGGSAAVADALRGLLMEVVDKGMSQRMTVSA